MDIWEPLDSDDYQPRQDGTVLGMALCWLFAVALLTMFLGAMFGWVI